MTPTLPSINSPPYSIFKFHTIKIKIKKGFKMNTKVIEKKYEEFINLEIYFNNILRERINRWIDIHRKKLFYNKYHNQRSVIKTYKSEDYRDFYNDEDNEYTYFEDYIEHSYEQSYSGCGTEYRSFNIDLELITTSEENLESYYLKKEKEIEKDNKELLLKQTTTVIKRKEETAQKDLENRRFQYEKLKKEFEKEGK